MDRYANPPPDTKAKVLEVFDNEIKVNVDGKIGTWPKHLLREAVPVVAGGRRRKASRKTRKGRKATRKSHRKGSRKVHRKSRRSSRK